MSPEQASRTKANKTGGAYMRTDRNEGYFTHEGDYIPPAPPNRKILEYRLEMEGKYKNEKERLAAGSPRNGDQASTPRERLFGPNAEAHQQAREGLSAPYTARAGEMDPATGQVHQHDVGSRPNLFPNDDPAAARRAAMEDFKQERPGSITRKSMFPVTRIPTVPHVQQMRWSGVGESAGNPSFAPMITAREPLFKRRRPAKFHA